ncbi:MAG: hypothetical protein LBH59_02785 [Planctomycetaceae bacterium]|nr:hypothetical protein [Planctomycetaceae bacterium]
MNKRSTLLRLPCSALRILKRLQHSYIKIPFRVFRVIFVWFVLKKLNTNNEVMRFYWGDS